jgi:hypothetical protein
VSAIDRLDDDHARLNALVPFLLGLVATGRPLADVLARAAAASPSGPELRPAEEQVVLALLGCVSFTRKLEACLERFANDAPPAPARADRVGERGDVPAPTPRELLR